MPLNLFPIPPPSAPQLFTFITFTLGLYPFHPLSSTRSTSAPSHHVLSSHCHSRHNPSSCTGHARFGDAGGAAELSGGCRPGRSRRDTDGYASRGVSHNPCIVRRVLSLAAFPPEISRRRSRLPLSHGPCHVGASPSLTLCTPPPPLSPPVCSSTPTFSCLRRRTRHKGGGQRQAHAVRHAANPSFLAAHGASSQRTALLATHRHAFLTHLTSHYSPSKATF